MNNSDNSALNPVQERSYISCLFRGCDIALGQMGMVFSRFRLSVVLALIPFVGFFLFSAQVDVLLRHWLREGDFSLSDSESGWRNVFAQLRRRVLIYTVMAVFWVLFLLFVYVVHHFFLSSWWLLLGFFFLLMLMPVFMVTFMRVSFTEGSLPEYLSGVRESLRSYGLLFSFEFTRVLLAFLGWAAVLLPMCVTGLAFYRGYVAQSQGDIAGLPVYVPILFAVSYVLFVLGGLTFFWFSSVCRALLYGSMTARKNSLLPAES